MADVVAATGATLLYEIDPTLNTKMPSQLGRLDGYYGLPEDVTMLQLEMASFQKER